MYTDLTKMTLRLPAAAAEKLREAAFAARLQPAVLARDLLARALERGDLPPPAPPAKDELSPEVKELITCIRATQSNLSQLAGHAARLGTPFSRLIEPSGGLLAELTDRLRALGIALAAGAAVPATAPNIHSAAVQLNTLARALNAGQNTSPESWVTPLKTLRSALES